MFYPCQGLQIVKLCFKHIIQKSIIHLVLQKNIFIKITKINNYMYKEGSLNSLKIIDETDYAKLLELYNCYCSDFNGYRKRDILYYKKYLIPRCIAYNEKIELFYEDTLAVGYVIYSKTKEEVKISEIIYLNQGYLDKMIGYFVKNNTVIYIETDMRAKCMVKVGRYVRC